MTAQLTEFLSHFTQPIVALDTHEQPLAANPAFYNHWGLDAANISPHWWTAVQLTRFGEQSDQYHLAFPATNGSPSEWQGRTQPILLGDQRIHLLFCQPIPETLPPMRNWQHAVKGLQQHQQELEDEIAERERIEQELREAQAQLRCALERERELSELKTRFIATASHEFRTPLSSILSSASLIERYTTSDQQPKRLKHVARIQSSVRNLTQILEDFLSLSALEEGDLVQHHQEIRVHELIQSVLETVEVFAKPNQQLKYQHNGPQRSLWINAQSLKNILLNLLSNAIKYSPEGATIQVVSACIQAPQHALQITVKDTGMGIPEAQQKHLFTRFFRADNATAIQGTGLGLYIVKKYAEALGGTIDLDSTLGVGTRVSFYLPLQHKHLHESS